MVLVIQSGDLTVTSLLVGAAGDPEDVGHPLVGRDEGLPAHPLLVVPQVFDPVGAPGGREGDVPLDGGVALLVRSLQPVEPETKFTSSAWTVYVQHIKTLFYIVGWRG